MSFWEGFFLASMIWVIVSLFAFMRGMNWSDGFNSGWDAAIEAMTEIAGEKGEQENGRAD